MPTDINAEKGAEAQQEALNTNRTVMLRRKKGATAILPHGKRVDATPFMHVRYDLGNQARILGRPEDMLTEAWRSEHAGWHYAWPIRIADSTAALLRAGWYVAVPHDAIDQHDPLAAISEVVTPGGKYVVWGPHLLVAIAPQYYYKTTQQYEDQAIARTVTNADSLEDMLDRQFGAGGFEAEISPFVNQRDSRTGD